MIDITTVGQAITPHPSYDKPGERGFVLVGERIITHENLELIDVFKCPNCGHSVSINEKGEPPKTEEEERCCRPKLDSHPLDKFKKKL